MTNFDHSPSSPRARTSLTAAAGETVLEAAARLALGDGAMSLTAVGRGIDVGPVIHASTRGHRTSVVAAPRFAGESNGRRSAGAGTIPVNISIETVAPLAGILLPQGSLRGVGGLRRCPRSAVTPGAASADLVSWALDGWEGARTYELVWEVMKLTGPSGSHLLEPADVLSAALDPVACASGEIIDEVCARLGNFATLGAYALAESEDEHLPPMRPGDAVRPVSVDRAGLTLLWMPAGRSYAVWVGFDEVARTPPEASAAIARLAERARWLLDEAA